RDEKLRFQLVLRQQCEKSCHVSVNRDSQYSPALQGSSGWRATSLGRLTVRSPPCAEAPQANSACRTRLSALRARVRGRRPNCRPLGSAPRTHVPSDSCDLTQRFVPSVQETNRTATESATQRGV